MPRKRGIRLPVTVGLDIHKRETQACAVDADGRVVWEKRFPTTRARLQGELAGFAGSRVVIESVGFHRPVANWLLEKGFEVHVAHPRAIAAKSVKTDRKDAANLAELLRLNALPEAWLAPEDVQVLRDIARHRQTLGQETARFKSKVKHDLLKHGHFVETNPADTEKGREWARSLGIFEITSSLNILDALRDETKVVDRAIEKITTNDPKAELLMTIPGVGAFTALVILAEVGDFSRFPSPDKLASYAGFAIREQQSGDRHWRGHITKEGSPLLRWMYVEAARNHVRYCPDGPIAKKYERLLATKGRQRATVAAARSLLHVTWAMMRDNTPFRSTG